MGDRVGSGFEQALRAELVASEQLRVRVLAATLAILLALEHVIFIFARDLIQQFADQPLSPWLPVRVVGPFVAYEVVVLLALRYRVARGKGMPTFARFANAIVETSLPTVLIWVVTRYTGSEIAFGGFPALLYFVFIAAATLRLDFVLPTFTGAVAAVEYLAVAAVLLPLSSAAADPIQTPLFHIAKAIIMLGAGIVAGLVAVRLRNKFRRAVEEAESRERVTNLFGQHVSPAVVDRLLERPAEFAAETRDICVMFLDIRDFTGQARQRPPSEVVEFLNRAFAFMIDAVDRHGGFINKFLGDGFMAVFGAPLEDAQASRNAVAAARDILAEIDRRELERGPWPLRVGIGLHAGPAVIGNVGSPRRKEFTAIGDTVNLAARIEQLNKEHGSRLLVSQSVVAALGDALGPATELKPVAVKGYAAPIGVWRLA